MTSISFYGLTDGLTVHMSFRHQFCGSVIPMSNESSHDPSLSSLERKLHRLCLIDLNLFLIDLFKSIVVLLFIFYVLSSHVDLMSNAELEVEEIFMRSFLWIPY